MGLKRVKEQGGLVLAQETSEAEFEEMPRNPDDAPDHDFSGYSFWLSKLEQFNGNLANNSVITRLVER